jgi:hypothetical protein
VRSQEYLPLNTTDEVYRATVNGSGFPKAPPYEWWAFHYAADAGKHAEPLHDTFRGMIDEQAKQVAFAEHIDLDKGTMVQRPIGDQYRVLFLRDRAGYPSRLIAGYDPATRAELLGGAFAGTRADWPAIIDPAVLDLCRQLVLGCVVCRLLLPQGAQFVYEVPPRPGTPRKKVALPRRFDDAVSTLASEGEWQTILRDLVDDRREDGGRARLEEAAQELVEQLDVRDRASRVLAAARGLQDIADREAYEHIQGFCRRFGLDLPPPPPPRWVAWHKKGATLANGKPALQDGWYCRSKECAFLYAVELDPVPNETECPSCHATGIG